MIENGNVPLDNNRAENAICPFTVGRNKHSVFIMNACIHFMIREKMNGVIQSTRWMFYMTVI